jgi:magnesium-transporting ATPase (P-type)
VITGPLGLTAADAAEVLAREGPNSMPRPRRPSAWRRFGGQLVHFFALMLWAAAVLAFVAGMPQLGIAIVVVVIVNGLFAFAQEQRAEHASERLVELLPLRVRVVRDGVTSELDATEVVRGDLVLLDAGDKVVADLEAVQADELRVDESMLTGESRPVAAGPGAPLWAGTFVVSGSGSARVVATGQHTRLADIAQLTATTVRPPGPLARELRRVVRTMATVTVSAGVAFFLLTRVTGMSARDGFLFAVGVTVALVPEGLLPTLTLSLAMGAQRMAARHALVRHLQAVETLGSTTVVCTDKTGTLTRNEMAVVVVWTPQGEVRLHGEGYAPTARVEGPDAAVEAARALAVGARWSSQGYARALDGDWVAVGDPMEAAIDACARRLGPPAAVEADSSRAAGPADDPPEQPTRSIGFSAERRRSSAVVGRSLFVKGAPEVVLPRCRAVGDAATALDRLTGAGLRVLAVARRDLGELAADATTVAPEVLEERLELMGLLALEDPPRDEVPVAVAACRSAGVHLVMITGDHPATAAAIAREIGLADAHGVVVTGDQLPDAEAELAELLDHDGVVVSRATPEHKLRIARALQSRGHVVAMTGDGVNDGPALREADIGVAMGRSGTDVARGAADLVLLDDDFSTIVAAIEEGRATFTNIRRFLTYHLTDNVAELAPFVIWGLSGGRVPLAIGVLQVLCLDIVTDLLPALALGAEPPSPGLLQRTLEGRHLIDAALLRRVFGVLGPTEAVVEMLAFGVGLLATGWRPGAVVPSGTALYAASGAAFAAVVLGQTANAQACRSATRPPRRLGWWSNRLLVAALGVQLALLGVMLWAGPLARLLGQAPPAPAAAVVAVAAIPAVLAADELHKRWRHRRGSSAAPA